MQSKRRMIMRYKIYSICLIVFVFVVSTAGQRAPSSSKTRTLTITTEANASVWLDGVLRGETDQDGELIVKPVSKGVHTLRVRAFGFKEVSQPVSATETVIRIALVKTSDLAEIAFQKAEKLLSEDKSKAIESYEKAIRLRPKYAEALLGLARAFADTGDYEAAHATVRKARSSRPVYPEASAVEGRIFRSEADIDKAIESFERAIREGKGFQPEAHTGLALILKDEAESASARGEYDLVALYYEDAANSFEKAIEQLSATEPVVYLLLGEIYEKTKQKEKAIAVYERFLRDMPENEESSAVESFIVQLRKSNDF